MMINKINIILFLSLIYLPSCEQNKIDDATRDITGTWQMQKKELNGVSDTDNFNTIFKDYTLVFSADGNFSETYLLYGTLPIGIAGTYIFQNSATEISLIDNTQTRIFEIIRLDGAHITVQLLGVPDEEIYYLIPKF